jgi:hypothetical protein
MTDLTITSVGYSRLVNLGNYENEKVTASARVEDGTDPDAVLASLKDWVMTRVADAERRERERDQAGQLQWDIRGLELQLAQAKQKWEAAERFLAAHGIDPGIPRDELPF